MIESIEVILKILKLESGQILKRIGLLSCLISLSSISMHANAQAHVHGLGEVLIVEENNRWQIEVIIPAIDLLGFESRPETTEQLAKVKSVINLLNSPDNMIRMPSFCSIENISHNLDSLVSNTDHTYSSRADSESLDNHHGHSTTDGHKHSHSATHDTIDKHKNTDGHSHAHSDGHHHNHDKHEQHVHKDVSATLSASCRQKAKSIEMKVFDIAESLQSMSVQWIVADKQGFVKITPSNSVIAF